MIRMLIVGYCFGIRSERRLCEEVHLNLAYRWFCRLGLDGEVPDHSTFSKNRHGRFRDSDLLREVFETTVRALHGRGAGRRRGLRGRCQHDQGRCQPAALRAGQTSGCRPRRRTARCGSIWRCSTMPPSARRRRSCRSSSRRPIPASRWTGANGGLAFFAYCTNYLIDLKHAVIVDVEATTAIRQAEVTAQRTA